MQGTACANDGNGNGTDDACESTVLYYHQDATGNLMALTDSTAQVVWRAEVHPFGQGVPAPSSRPTRFIEQERERDIGTADGLYLMGARLYDPTTGRFLSPDPLPLAQVRREDPQQFNRFSYALNSPYRFLDPTGRQPEEEANKTKDHGKKIGEISTIVSKDKNFNDSVDSALKYVPVISSGAVRNFLYMISGEDPGDPATAKKVCTGISDQAVILINKAIKAGDLKGVKRAQTLERRNQPGRENATWHTAVLVEFDDGSKVVLDWHATLDPQSPKVTTPEDF